MSLPVDVLFWGRDEDELARRVGAGQIDDGLSNLVFGWMNLTLDQTRSQLGRIQTPAPSAPAELQLVDFTSWGDGAFPVFRDLDADAQLVRLRVELGTAGIVERTARIRESYAR